MRTLTAQAESYRSDGHGHWYGYEVFEVDGGFELVVHTSTYDGVRRDSHWASPAQPMESQTRDGAIREAAHKTAAYARAMGED